MKSKRFGRRATRRGFTLIEVMIVIGIILVLVSLVGVALFAQRDRAKKQLVELQMRNIAAAMEQFRLVYDRYPTDEEGIKVLWDKESLETPEDQDKWTEFLTERKETDEYGHEWGYRAESEFREGKFDLWSLGKDGEEGTEDDIQLWKTDSGEGGDFEFGDSPSGSGGG